MIATGGFLTALECTKLVFGPRTPLGSLQRSPDTLATLSWTTRYKYHQGPYF